MMLKRNSLPIALLSSVSLLASAQAYAGKSDLYGNQLADSTAELIEIGANTETTVAPQKAGELFSISVDGEHVAGTKPAPDPQRKTDLDLESVDVQVKFDGLGVKPILNVSTMPVRRAYAPGETVAFLASNNYPAWIASAEIRIFDADDKRRELPIDVVTVSPEGGATWIMPKSGSGQFAYVLRVADGEGRYDETKPLSIIRDGLDLGAQELTGDGVAPGYGEDRTATRNIPVYGGAITVSGIHVPEGNAVTVLGDPVPVDGNGSFVIQRILPPGDHAIDVDLQGEGENGLSFNRSVNIPDNEWFYVGLADFTLGKRFGSDNIEAVKPDEYKGVYTKGRLAFYLKGKIKGRYLLTASADTSEKDLKNL
ncbi:MAG: TonB-dependent receptor, partial [Rhizobiaceae bacterium]